MLVGGDAQVLLGEDQRAEPAAAARAQRRRGAVERQFVARLDFAAGDRLDLLERQRRGGEDARRGRAADDFADREERFARQRVVRLERRRAAVGHQELAALAARRGDAVGKCGGEPFADAGEGCRASALIRAFGRAPPSPARGRGPG